MPDSMPDAQRLAALLDGRLGAAEREQLLGELAASDDLLDVYADAATALGELERAGSVAPVPRPVPAPVPRLVGPPAENSSAAEPSADPNAASAVVSLDEWRDRPRPRQRWRVPRRAALAAGAAVVALAPALWWRAHPANQGEGADSGSYVALLAPAARAAGLPAGWNGAPWRVTRGAGDPLTPEARAVRVGARLTDLELAAAARDSAAARAAAAEVAALLDDVPGAGASAATYRALETSAARDAAALAAARRDAVLEAGADHAALGMWLEAARVAAARRDAAFFRTRASRAALERLRGSGAGREDVPEKVERVAAAVSREPPAWDALGEALGAVLRALGG